MPSYLRFGTFLLQLRHDRQQLTCRRCNQPGHFAFECANKLCFNCEQCPSRVLCNICKEVGHLAKSCIFSWSRAEPVQPSVTDEARAVDVEGLVSHPHQMETPVSPEIIPPSPSSPTVPPALNETVPKEQQTANFNVTAPDEKLLDFQGKLLPESTPTNVISRPPLTDSQEVLMTTENRFNVLMEPDDTSDKQDGQTNLNPTVLLGLVRKETSPQLVTGKSKPILESTSIAGKEEMEVQQAQGRKRGPDEPPPKFPPKRKGSRCKSKARTRTSS